MPSLREKRKLRAARSYLNARFGGRHSPEVLGGGLPEVFLRERSVGDRASMPILGRAAERCIHSRRQPRCCAGSGERRPAGDSCRDRYRCGNNTA